MWIETQSLELVNVQRVSRFKLHEPFEEKFGWAIEAIVDGDLVLVVSGSETAVRAHHRMLIGWLESGWSGVLGFPILDPYEWRATNPHD